MLLLVVALAIVIPASVVLGLKIGSVRALVLARVADAVEERAGIRLRARDFRVGLTAGVVEVFDLELAASGAGEESPFLVVPHARGVVRWRTLRGDVPVIESLAVLNPRFDPGAPLPSFGDAEDETGPGGDGSAVPALELLDFDLAGGEILGALAPDSMDVWLDAWRADGIRVRGALHSGTFRIEEATARGVVESHRRQPLELLVEFAASGDTRGESVDLDSLRLRAAGLALDGHGRVASSTADARLAFDVDVDAARLFPDLTAAGRLSGSGDLRLERSAGAALGGVLRIDATDIPVELAHPWVAPEGGGIFNFAGTRLDVALDLDANVALSGAVGSHPSDKLLGTAEVNWRRGTEQLLEASIHSLDRNEGVNLSFAAELTPAAPGRRRVEGELRAPALADVFSGTLRAVRVDLIEPDAEDAAVRFGLDPRLIPPWWPRGEVLATLEADGPVSAPGMRLNARWDHEGGEPLVVFSARTLDDPGLRLECETSFLPQAPGVRKLSGELVARGWDRIGEGEIHGGRLNLEFVDLGDAEEDLARRLPELLPEGLVPDEIPEDLIRGSLSARAEIAGPVSSPEIDLVADWAPAAGEGVYLVIRGRPSGEFPFLRPGGEAALDLDSLSLSRFDALDPPQLAGRVDASLRFRTTVGGGASSLTLDGHELSYGDLVALDRLRLEAASDGESIELRELSGTLAAGTPEFPVGGPFTATGQSDVAWPPRDAEVRLAISDPVDGIDRVEAVLRLVNGLLLVEPLEIATPGNVASSEGQVPLGAWVEGFSGGPVSLSVTNLDLGAVTALFAPDDAAFSPQGRLNGAVTFDPADPISTTGYLELSEISVDAKGETPLELGQTVRIEMGDGRMTLPPTRLQPTGKLIRGTVPLNIEGAVNLARDWRPGDELVAAVESVTLDLDGTVDAALLNPFLAGGSAGGEVGVTVTARGAPDSLNARVAIRGPAARVLYLRPYPTRLEALEVDLVARRGEIVLERARAKLNGGSAEMTGTVSETDGLRANLRFDGARYRLDFGIAARLRGNLRLEWPARGRQRIAGTIVVERAVLRRNIALGRDMLGALFDVGPESGGASSLGTIDLDLTVETDQGLMIKNNIADLQADWGRVEITGTAENPIFDGRVDVQSGGIITAFGQALRIDEASFEWSGSPVTEPRMVFETTSSLEDPSIMKSWRNEFFTPADMGPGRGGSLDFWGGGEATQQGGWEQFATGAITQATSTGRTQLTFEPLPLFGETDSQARFTIASDLSPQLAFIASTNPREAEAQTYILDIHRMPVLQSFRAQVFTNDQKNAGLTLQQTLKLGARAATETRDPFLKSTTVVIPDGVSKRRVKGAIGYRKSDPFPTGAGLDVEVDVIDLMRKKGYPSATVGVGVEQVGDNRVSLLVTVEPGAPVRFVFEGDPLPSGVRSSIAFSYRPVELGERASLEEVQRETVTALRGLGYLDPRADIESVPADPANPDEPATVRVIADGGRRIELAEIVVEGLPEEVAERAAGLFGSTLSKMQLAVAAPAADTQLLRFLDRQGFQQSQITGRELSDDGETLVLRIEPGPRRRLASVEIVGLAEEDRARLAKELDVREGDAARLDQIILAGSVIERDLRDRGHADARVEAQVNPIAEDRPTDVALRYEVDPGPSYRIQEVRFEGLKSSRRSWVERTAGLESGQLFRRRDVAEARARLFRTNVFRRIRTSTDERSGSDATVTFELEESRRWQLAYGGRWEEGLGVSAVVDVLNRHSLGIGHLTGVRLIYGSALQNLRLYHVIPRVVGERSSLELLIEGKYERLTSNIDLQTTEAWAQLTFPMTRRTHNRPYIRFQNPRLTERTPDPDSDLDDRVISPLLGWQVAFDALSRRIGEDRRRGVFAGIDLLGSLEELGSDVTYFGLVGQVKYFLPFGRSESGRFTWAQFWRGGWTEAKDSDVPFVDRFRLGGEFSVRGYPTNSLGPLDENGFPLGGEVLFIVNQELHAQLLRTERAGSVSALAFFDAGNVWENRDSVSGSLFKAVGVGARYNSPIGPLRLDYAVPLDRRPDDPSYKVYLGFGSVF